MASPELPTEQEILTAPYKEKARELAAAFAGADPTTVRRFTTGAGHYVFEVEFLDHPPLVVRITRPRYRSLCRDAAQLSMLLRPVGVPLPRLFEDGSSAPVPYLLLERLPGKDLWEVLNGLLPEALERIAARVAAAQSIVAAMPTAGRYGYAASADRAPFDTWAKVLDANLGRSRERIEAAGLFDAEAIRVAAALVAKHRAQLNSTPATPFLHDTTTKNVIVADGGEFSGIVDVDDLCFGDPRYVIALTYTAVRNQRGPVAYIEHWLDRARYEKDALFWLYVAVFLVDFMSEHGQQFNGNQRASSKEQRRHLVELFTEVVQRLR